MRFRRQFGFEGEQIHLDHLPDDLEVQSEIVVDYPIAQSRDLTPLDIRGLDEVRRQSAPASPIISKLRTTASMVFSSARNFS